MMAVMMAGSTLPLRVPIMTPSSGVYPMVVSIEMPWSMAAKLTPDPIWQVTILRSWGLAPMNCAARRLADLWLMP